MSIIPTEEQISAGGVAYRRQGDQIEIALILVGDKNRWQLPKGLIDEGESSETAAMREVREETGLETELIELIDKVEYWYYSKGRHRLRFHKFVYFYLMQYKAGHIDNHDREVKEARWVEIEAAREMLAFKSEKSIVDKAKEMLKSL